MVDPPRVPVGPEAPDWLTWAADHTVLALAAFGLGADELLWCGKPIAGTMRAGCQRRR